MVKYYELKMVAIPENEEGSFRTAAFLDCDLCGEPIDSSGGPGNGAFCIRCGDLVKEGTLRGLVNWDEIGNG